MRWGSSDNGDITLPAPRPLAGMITLVRAAQNHLLAWKRRYYTTQLVTTLKWTRIKWAIEQHSCVPVDALTAGYSKSTLFFGPIVISMAFVVSTFYSAAVVWW